MGISAVVVDDDPASARAVALLLEQAACRVSICTDPESAISMALASDIDVVSLDIKMPRLDGFQVLALIRSHEHSRRAPSVPVIAVTGSVAAEDKAQALSLGFVAHLGKPLSLVDVHLALAAVRALRDDLYRTRYSVDQQAICGQVDSLLAGAGSKTSQAVTGLAIVMAQQGAQRLQQMLECAYQRDFNGAAEAASRLADAGIAVGATHLAKLCASFIDALDDEGYSFERQAVLARAELDRIVFTLRERVLT